MAVTRQRGFATTVLLYAVLALAVMGAAAYAIATYNRALQESVRLKAANQALAANVDTLTRAHQDQLAENHLQRQRQKRTGELLAAALAQRRAGAETERKIDDKLNHIAHARPEVRAWADSIVPGAVLIGLRLDTGAGGEGGQDHSRGAAAGPAAARGNP